jgi:hypothetical protein
MMEHTRYIGQLIPHVGNEIEKAFNLDGKRAHFVLLVWVDDTVQSVSNSPKEDVMHMLREHAGVIERGELIPGPADDPGPHQPV